MVIVLTSNLCADAQRVRSMAADLTFNFKCDSWISSQLDERFEHFLKEKKFDVLNVPRLRRERGMTSEPLNFLMDAVDEERRIITILSSGGSTPDWYSLQLNSPPPTRHATNLEEQILMFVSDTLGCRVRRVVRSENGSEVSDFYAGFFKMMRNRIREGNNEL
jgi:hypothetical protein